MEDVEIQFGGIKRTIEVLKRKVIKQGLVTCVCVVTCVSVYVCGCWSG